MTPKLVGFLPDRPPPCRPFATCRPLPQSGLWLRGDGRVLWYNTGLWALRGGRIYSLSGLRGLPSQPGLYQRGLAGLGAIDDLQTRLDVLQAEYDSLKAESAALISAHPELDGVSYEEFARRIASLAPGTIVRLTLGQFQQIANATFISATGNLVRARSLMPLGDAARSKIEKLLTAGKNTLHAFRNLLDGIERASADAAQIRRAVGLGALGLAPAAIIALIVAGTIVIVVGAVLVYAALSAQHASTLASQEADRMCALDAARGTPCTGAQREAYRARVLESETRSGLVPDLGNAIRQAGSTLFWGGMLAVGGLLAYGAWITAPAAQITRERLRARAGA